MSVDTDSEMKNVHPSGSEIEKYRKLVQTSLKLHLYESALFWAEKVVVFTNKEPSDVYWYAQCMYYLKQYHRAAHLIKSLNLEKTYYLCNNLTVRCLLEASEFKEALSVSDLMGINNDTAMSSFGGTEPLDDTPKKHVISSLYFLRGKVLDAMDNRGLAAECYKQALQLNVKCYEAFQCLIQHNMLSAEEEQDLINTLPIEQQCSSEETDVLLLLYRSKLKKYHTPSEAAVKISAENNVNVAQNTVEMESAPSPMSETVSTNLPKPMDVEIKDGPLIQKLNDSLDLNVDKAEQLYYNCEYQKCICLTESILKQDPFHSGCLPVHVACLVEHKKSNELFKLAHRLVDLYPDMAISWFAVGCYYYVIGKCDSARRYLNKATCLDRLFGPAWLAYGHSFAADNEHDQAMAAYFKASQLMKGCHLPLMYIGLECGLTNNVRLAEKFLKQAKGIAPIDPSVLHELGVIAFQNSDYQLAEGYFKSALYLVKSRQCSVEPEHWAPLHNNLGHTLRKRKMYKQALAQHHKALVLTPQCSKTYSAIAFVHALMNNLEESVVWFHKALALQRDDTFSTTMLNYAMEQLAEEPLSFQEEPEEGIPNFKLSTPLDSTTSTSMKTPAKSLEEPSSSAMSGNLHSSEMSIDMEMSDNIVSKN